MNTSTIDKLTLNDIRNTYTSGYKLKADLKVGIEYERIPVVSEKFISAEYGTTNGICNLLRIFARNNNWDYILDENDIIGLKQGHDTITLEPGSQLELSLEPKKKISDIEARIDEIDVQFIPILADMDIELLNYGVSPLSTYKDIKLIPKKRYHIMANYLWGILSDVMMRETAGIQGTFDFISEEDAMLKFRVANMLSPITTAMFANSPIRGGVDTGYKSFRALSWLFTDNDRCGFYCNFNSSTTFDDYIKFVLDTPMLFVKRENNIINFDGNINFTEYMNLKNINTEPTLDDYLLQANLCFPEVRLRNFIEIRNHDCNGGKLTYAVLALYKGILYNPDACEAIINLFKNFKSTDFQELRFNVPKYALDSQIGSLKVKDYAKEILKISEKALKTLEPDECDYLDSIKEFTFKGLTPADIILKNWYGAWNKDISKFIDFITKNNPL